MKTLTTLMTGLLIASTTFAARGLNDVRLGSPGDFSPITDTNPVVYFTGTTVDKLGEDLWSMYIDNSYILIRFDGGVSLDPGTAMLVSGTFGGYAKYRSTMTRILDLTDYEIK